MARRTTIKRCGRCGKHPWFTPCTSGNHQPSFTLRLIQERDADILESENSS